MTQEPASSKEQLATVVVNRGILHLCANPQALLLTEAKRNSGDKQAVLSGWTLRSTLVCSPGRYSSASFEFELDTGAAVTVMSEKKFLQLFPNHSLKHSLIDLKTYTGEARWGDNHPSLLR